ncbi:MULTISPECIES: thiamine pyrophosphate-dependent dehydrogenase E1 component subunit alpha [Alphaproteobacteria]|uniref:Acetoin:2,6-dichlorophenolindophenol oxidoreductase subunit alpha n=2 Tax=Alphaproteobacteria TaxID=28211 RepID=A0A512HQ87_9HYPH|nr:MULTISPECIES: thiamine pyrophosphate-dependent dehydrogenase E1 component subunit alpha [Alphaproteobacteria]GEO87589.1 acetoin:2,6-dichlorophenolindophenol oxidoreductase subunit alpha [Ciceribacter naphthalenivorans]GLR23916.1 acetoin:2,6-dichlorophenolindophenol oxidoreductase subunit alpha [Ciceribacter naphthalenivorans]GLT06772.1 acetoin:2,6-dichlorophenolindophenol oxidoreductase subunit alpha [Sphingomonas psychrolutea]
MPTKSQLLWMYEIMEKARCYEDTMAAAYMEGKSPKFDIGAGPLPGEMHLSAGQEPCAAAVCVHLRADDTVTATHRPHHAAIAKGVDLKKMTAEIFGKASGLGGGRGGHMHLLDPAVNFVCSGIIAEGAGPAVGAALAAKLKGSDAVAVSYVGDGAANQGAFHESLNLAALWKLPVLFVIEDNGWGISVPKSASTAVVDNSVRAAAYGIPGFHVADNNTLILFDVAKQAVSRARRGDGPTLIEVETYRYYGHFQGDPELYRPKGEVAALKAKDPIARFRRQIIGEGVTEAEANEAASKAKREVDEAFTFARAAAYPAPSDALTQVFA